MNTPHHILGTTFQCFFQLRSIEECGGGGSVKTIRASEYEYPTYLHPEFLSPKGDSFASLHSHPAWRDYGEMRVLRQQGMETSPIPKQSQEIVQGFFVKEYWASAFCLREQEEKRKQYTFFPFKESHYAQTLLPLLWHIYYLWVTPYIHPRLRSASEMNSDFISPEKRRLAYRLLFWRLGNVSVWFFSRFIWENVQLDTDWRKKYFTSNHTALLTISYSLFTLSWRSLCDSTKSQRRGDNPKDTLGRWHLEMCKPVTAGSSWATFTLWPQRKTTQ